MLAGFLRLMVMEFETQALGSHRGNTCVLYTPVFRLPRELVGCGCYRGSKFCLAFIFCFFFWLGGMACGFYFPIGSFFLPASHLCYFSGYLKIPTLFQQKQIIPPLGLAWESNLRTPTS